MKDSKTSLQNRFIYDDEVFEALGLRDQLGKEDPGTTYYDLLDKYGVDLIDSEVGDDYSFTLRLRQTPNGDVVAVEGSLKQLPNLDAYGIELLTVGQRLRKDGCLSQLLLCRSVNKTTTNPWILIDRRQWISIVGTVMEVQVSPKAFSDKVDQHIVQGDSINLVELRRCGNCRLWDRKAGQEEYMKITHEDQPFGGDRPMWKDIADQAALDRNLRRLNVDSIGLCLKRKSIIDRNMTACDDWREDT